MEIDPNDLIESARSVTDQRAARSARLNAAVAITVAVLATFMGICKVKDDNIVQAMQQAQADKLDHWAFYQARNIRQDLAEAAATQLELARLGASAANAAAYDAAIATYREHAQDQAKKKEALKVQAEQDQKAYDALNYRDDQFDLSDAALSICLGMLAVTALTNKRRLLYLSWLFAGFGLVMGLAGLLGLHLHPDILTKLLS